MESAAKDIGLFLRQGEFLRADGNEVLALGKSGGKSHAMRLALILRAAAEPNSSCVLIHPNSAELHREHVEGGTGFKAMLAEAVQAGAVEFRADSNEARFANGSVVRWAGLDRESDIRHLMRLRKLDMGCVDEADRVARDQYEILLGKASYTIPRGKIFVASERLTGWLKDTWPGDGRAVVEFGAEHLPEDLRIVAELPTLEEFIDSIGSPFLAPDGDFRQARHVKALLAVLQRWFFGEFERLMILMPTQHGKTLLGVRVMAAYIQLCRPHETVGIVSYSDGVASNRNKGARDFYQKAGGKLLAGSGAGSYWKTPYGGGSWSVGFGGAAAGNPMTWGIVDDPDKNKPSSKSTVLMQSKDDWYLETWLGREAKYANRRMSQLWAATRFWRHDTAGRVLDVSIKRGDPWHILALPALYDPAVARYYEALSPAGLITVEPDFRTKYGEPLDPERYGRDYWEKDRLSDPSKHAGRNQQKPEDLGGGTMFNESWAMDIACDPAFRVGSSPRKAYALPIRSWDFAATAGGGDWTACVSMGEERDSGRLVIRHAAHARLSSRDVLRFVAGTMLLDGPEVDIVLPDDPAAGGKHQVGRIVDYLRKVAKLLTVPCRCSGGNCQECGGSRVLRFRVPLIRLAETRSGVVDRFQGFANRARPISEDIEGSVDFVAEPWRPHLRSIIPWFARAVERVADRDDRADLVEIERMMETFVGGTDPDMAWADWAQSYLRELHTYTNNGRDHDDWAASTAYGWGELSAPRSVYPGAV